MTKAKRKRRSKPKPRIPDVYTTAYESPGVIPRAGGLFLNIGPGNWHRMKLRGCA